MDDSEKYALSRAAQKSGGPCPLCNWQDGDGVRTCFYSHELGMVTHQNSDKGVMASMTPEQQHLYQLRQELVYISPELRELSIQQVAWDHHLYVEAMLKQRPDCYPVQDEEGNPMGEEAWVARYRTRAETEKPCATDPQYAGWLQEYWWIPVERQGYYGTIPEALRGPVKESTLPISGRPFLSTAYKTHVYEPHCCGKGRQYQKEPYVLACTGCATEIKLWEHGVDYDMG